MGVRKYCKEDRSRSTTYFPPLTLQRVRCPAERVRSDTFSIGLIRMMYSVYSGEKEDSAVIQITSVIIMLTF